MRYLIDTTTDPYYNLAAEEYLLKQCNQPVFRLWRNAPSVIVGHYQNTIAEINSDYVHEHKIPVVRRLSGGGAVFHDLGNINFTFIDSKVDGEDTSDMFARFTSPIIDALRNIGIEAYLEGRNDLLIDGRKFSGNAICVSRDRVLQHGTLLFSASMSSLAGVLNTRPEKFIGKGVKSNVSRVTNISEHLPAATRGEIDVAGFMQYLGEYIIKGGDCDTYSDEEISAINRLADTKYRTDKWNYGTSPKYSFTNSSKLTCGLVEAFLLVDKGIIRECRLLGDYFFLRPTEEVEQLLIGLPHTKTAILSALCSIPINEYFSNSSAEEIADLLS